MGIWDVIKKHLTFEENRHHADVDENIGKNVFEIASFDVQNATLAEKISYFLNNRSQGEQIQLADQLLREGPYEASIEMYNALIKKYPEERDRYENGIGTAYMKLGQFDKAIEYYLASLDHGMHPAITDKNIWDVCQKQHKESGEDVHIESYLSYFPEGKYTIQAKVILNIALPEGSAVQEAIEDNLSESSDTETDNGIKELLNEIQNIGDVAKKNKKADENQFSLFGFGEEADATDATDNIAPDESNDEPVTEEKETAGVTQDSLPEQNPKEKIPVDEAPNMLLALDHHIDRFFDNEDIIVWQDKRNDGLRIDVYHVRPNEDRRYNLLLSYGMSREPMNVPEGAEQFEYGELAIILPEDWDLSAEGLKDFNNYWPILWLKNLARIPKQHNTWLCYGHSVPHGTPSKNIANTPFEGVIIMDSVSLYEEFQEMKLGDDSLFIYTVIPVFPDEMEYKIKNGVDALRDSFAEAGIIDIVDVNRSSSVQEQKT